jgi:hypothetical protein
VLHTRSPAQTQRLSVGGTSARDGVRPVRTPSTQQRPENFLDDLANSGPAVRLFSEGEVMTQYLVAIYRPENYAPAVSEDEAMGRK